MSTNTLQSVIFLQNFKTEKSYLYFFTSFLKISKNKKHPHYLHPFHRTKYQNTLTLLAVSLNPSRLSSDSSLSFRSILAQLAAIDDHVQHVTEIPNEEVDATEESEMNPNSNSEDIEEMKKRLKEKEDEDRALLEMQAKVGKGMSEDAAGASSAALTEKEEADSRSIYVGNVDYACAPEEVQKHFQSCGTVNRVTILTDKLGLPKGYAYVEFVEIDAVQNALLLNESELHGRQLKVSAKRTNVPGMKQHRARRPNLYMAYQSPFLPPSFYSSPYGYGKAPRYRRPMRFGPYN